MCVADVCGGNEVSYLAPTALIAGATPVTVQTQWCTTLHYSTGYNTAVQDITVQYCGAPLSTDW